MRQEAVLFSNQMFFKNADVTTMTLIKRKINTFQPANLSNFTVQLLAPVPKKI